MQEPADAHVYHGINVPADILQLFMNAARFYADTVEADLASFRLDDELAKLLDERTLRSFRVRRDIDEARRVAERATELLPQAESMGGIDMPMSHGHVRFLKAICLLYIGELEKRRNAITEQRTIAARGLEVLDTKLLDLREAMDEGVFGRATAVPLLVSPEASERPARAADPVTITATTRVVNIDLVDQELRARCLDLFNNFADADQAERFDTIVMEATRILEDRVRKLSGLGSSSSGLDLVTSAFGTKTPRLRVSDHAPEQEGIHQLFRGVIGFIRNPVHHRIESIQKERAVQIVGFIDYLLHVAESADVITA